MGKGGSLELGDPVGLRRFLCALSLAEFAQVNPYRWRRMADKLGATSEDYARAHSLRLSDFVFYPEDLFHNKFLAAMVIGGPAEIFGKIDPSPICRNRDVSTHMELHRLLDGWFNYHTHAIVRPPYEVTEKGIDWLHWNNYLHAAYEKGRVGRPKGKRDAGAWAAASEALFLRWVAQKEQRKLSDAQAIRDAIKALGLRIVSGTDHEDYSDYRADSFIVAMNEERAEKMVRAYMNEIRAKEEPIEEEWDELADAMLKNPEKDDALHEVGPEGWDRPPLNDLHEI